VLRLRDSGARAVVFDGLTAPKLDRIRHRLPDLQHLIAVDETERVTHGRRGHRRDRFGGAGDVNDDAGLDGTGPDRRGMLVSGSDDHRATRRETELRGDVGQQRADNLGRRAHRREQRRVQIGCRTERFVEVASGDVVHHRGRRVRGVLGVRPGQVVQQIRPDRRERRRTLPDRGFVVADPHHLRCTVRGIRDQTRPLGQRFLTDRGDQTVALLGGPFVQPDDRLAQRRTLGVTRDDTVYLTAKAHRHDSRRVDARGRHADGVSQCGAVGLRILFRPAVVQVCHGQRGRTAGHDVASLVDEDDLDALRADVDPQDQRHVFPQITASESACPRSRSR